MASPPTSECFTSSQFGVIYVSTDYTKVHMRHKMYGIFVAQLGDTITNIDKAYLGDTVRVTLSFMPDMKTLYLVKASILFSTEDRRHEIREMTEPHVSINGVDMVARDLCRKFLKCKGRDEDGVQVGWTSVIKTLMATRFCKRPSTPRSTTEARTSLTSVSNNRPTRATVIRTTPVLPTTVPRQPRRERVEVQLPSPRVTPLLPTPQVSPESSEESTTMTVKKSKRQEENVIEEVAENDKSDEEVKRMSRREVVGRIKKAVFSSPKLLQQIANVDPELVAGIAAR